MILNARCRQWRGHRLEPPRRPPMVHRRCDAWPIHLVAFFAACARFTARARVAARVFFGAAGASRTSAARSSSWPPWQTGRSSSNTSPTARPRTGARTSGPWACTCSPRLASTSSRPGRFLAPLRRWMRGGYDRERRRRLRHEPAGGEGRAVRRGPPLQLLRHWDARARDGPLLYRLYGSWPRPRCSRTAVLRARRISCADGSLGPTGGKAGLRVRTPQHVECSFPPSLSRPSPKQLDSSQGGPNHPFSSRPMQARHTHLPRNPGHRPSAPARPDLGPPIAWGILLFASV